MKNQKQGKQKNQERPAARPAAAPASVQAYSPARLDYWLSVIVAIFGFALFANSIPNEYVLDDFPGIVDNPLVQQGFKGIPDLFKVDFWHFANLSLGYYRPLALITFAIEHQFFGANPHISHFVNVFLFAFTGFMLCMLLMDLFSKYRKIIPFLVCLLFMAHPIHTEVVSNIKSRDEILSFLGVVSSLYLMIRYAGNGKTAYLVSAILVYYLAYISKETAITLLVLLPAALYIFKQQSIAQSLLRTIPMFLVMAVFYMQKTAILGTLTQEQFYEVNNYPYVDAEFPSSMKVFFYFVKMLIWPYPLRYDYSYNVIPAGEWGDMLTLAGLVLFATCVYFAIRNGLSRKLSGFGLLVFMGSLVPAMGFIWMRGGIFAERFLYAATLGFAILMVLGLMAALRISAEANTGESAPAQSGFAAMLLGRQKILMACMLLLAGVYGVITVNRNLTWHDNIRLFSTDLKKSLNSAQNNKHLGHELLEVAMKEKDTVRQRQLLDTSIVLFRNALAINPRFGEAYGEMGRAWHDIRFNQDSAIKYYKSSIIITPGAFNAYSNLGLVYLRIGKLKLASYYFNKSFQINPNFAIARQRAEEIKRATGIDVYVYPLDEADGPQVGVGDGVAMPSPPIR